MASNSTDDWERLWQVVRTNPDDFNSWEQLIRLVESVEGGITASSPPENVTRLESVFDGFLEKFPLCFGYWRKYADWELAVHGDAGAEKIYERGIAAIFNSIDLWNQYLDFKLAHTQSNDEILGLFERAAGCVGLDFLGHPFWDKYLDFAENKLSDPQLVLQLLDRIVLIPMHQYARYYEKWRGIRQAASTMSEVLDAETLERYTQEIFEEKGTTEIGDDLEALLKEKVHAHTAEVYKNTQEGTNKRWVYEAEIKRSYFHVKPLDRPQLQNWNKYLDFEESLNQPERIRALYERCLVPCAQYEDYWLRYGHWLIKNNLITDARKAYERASYTFLPRERTSIKIALGLVLEEEGQIEEARKIYTTVLDTTPTHVETILNYLHFERRQNPSAFKDLCATYTQAAHLTKSATAFFTVQLTRFLQLVNQYSSGGTHPTT
ncbi:hypothetical protein K501DRAFT_289347 [Backusella circina FSU 941]|nr:hypothetical protein K501DRAFT_289347 [Backusella circina FSU 941]